MTLNNNFTGNGGGYLRPRVVYTKGPSPLSVPNVGVSSLSNMMLNLSFQDNQRVEKYSRKVFIGGLPPDINESESFISRESTLWVVCVMRKPQPPIIFLFSEEIYAAFRKFGALSVNWPQKGETRPHYPPRGYAFLIFQVRQCIIVSTLVYL